MKSDEQIPLIDASSTNNKPVEYEHTFSWSNVSVSRPQNRTIVEVIRGKPPKPPRVILQNMFGIARPGEVLAIMGASGVGKTTLLNVLIGYQDPTANISQGSICLNGYPTTRSQRLNGSLIGFAEQHELFVETMLLEEHLIFQAMLRMPRTMKDEDRRARVKTVMNLLALNKSFKTEIDRLSGGERKRLSLATVLLANPPIILIDEPTSGLDAYLAKQAMVLIRSLATERRHSLVVVIHQPTRDMYDLMDSLAVITHGGRLSYFGSRKRAADFFESQCRMKGSSLDNFIEQLAVPPESEESERASLMVADCYAQSDYAVATLDEISKLSAGINMNEKSRFPQEEWNSSIWRQFKWLLWRAFISGGRDPVRTVNVVIRCIIPAILFGIMYFNIPHNSKYKQNVDSITYATLSITTMSCSSVIVSTLPIDIPVYVRESRRRIYQTLPYFGIVILRELPLMILLPLVFSTIVYWLANISDHFVHYVEFTAIMILSCNSWASIGTFVSAFSDDIESAVATFMPIQQVLLAFCGFFFYLPSLPRFFIFIPYIAPLYYSYSALHALESNWNPFDYDSHCPKPDYGAIGNKTITHDLWCEEQSKFESQFPPKFIGFNIAMLAVLYAVYNTLAFLIIWYRGNRNRIVDFLFKKK